MSGRPQFRNDRSGNYSPQSATSVPANFIRGDMRMIMEEAQRIGIRLKDATVDMNQIRNFYESVVQLGIELRDERRPDKQRSDATSTDGTKKDAFVRQAVALPTKLVWAAAKQDRDNKRVALKELYSYVDASVKDIFEGEYLQFERYERFQEFVEAVVIYHKAQSVNLFR